ncbi:chromate efflux transporter [Aeromicrobium duanguangcaii]|uniref:chromate efflux transporter n=1 Tax=Aeromicrobium duanguangcaii TaxID=2968086 RepID=UPI0020170198|nr:chromate efflux transporter [Aeromicrobium duanguangcaii]MCL3838199.1 chromate efflux transporter [Aeromicrobium duanguangcaii]
MTSRAAAERRHPGSVAEVFWVFLRLGLTSFGGPVAHLAYFREAFVERRRWLTDEAYADLVALCQFLPGPGSSQVGMVLGLRRAGAGGLLAAWIAFTLPSAVLLVAFAYGVAAFGDPAGAGWLHGVKAAAVAVVAQAVLSMARTLTPDLKRLVIAAAGAACILLVAGPGIQIGVIVLGGLAGWLWLRAEEAPAVRGLAYVSRRAAIAALVAFGFLLVALPVLAAVTEDPTLRLADIFYRTGALVFGGGHVVLPLLQAQTVEAGLVDPDTFLAGYGAAQAVPGPLFTFSAYLGASMESGPNGVLGATIALVAVFLPAGLLVVGVLPFWDRLREAPTARRVVMGVNAAVVGILAAALYDPVITQGIVSVGTALIAVAVFASQWWGRIPVWAAVLAAAALGQLIA